MIKTINKHRRNNIKAKKVQHKKGNDYDYS